MAKVDSAFCQGLTDW